MIINRVQGGGVICRCDSCNNECNFVAHRIAVGYGPDDKYITLCTACADKLRGALAATVYVGVYRVEF